MKNSTLRRSAANRGMGEESHAKRFLYLCSVLWLLSCIQLQLFAKEYSDTKTLGPVTVTTNLNTVEPRLGDLLSLEIEVRAEAGVEVLMPEFGSSISGLRITQYIPKKRINDDGSRTESIAYEFQVEYSGEHSIQPIAIEFIDNRPGKKPSPDEYDAYELVTERIDFQVASVLVQDASRELKPPLPELSLASTSTKTSSYLLWALAGCLLVVLGIAFAWVKTRSKTARKANAYELARARLDRVLQARDQGQSAFDAERYFVEITAVIRRYLEDRYEVRAPELTTDEFLQAASKHHDMSRDHQELLREFLSQADLVKFAGVGASESDMQRSADLAIRFLEETRWDAPDVLIDEELGGKHAIAPPGLSDGGRRG